MKEFLTSALVLDKEDWGECDARVFLYSVNYGKITVKVKSAKKLTSKLNSHLEPGNIVRARVIDRGPQIVDALIIERLQPTWPLHALLNFIKATTLEGHPDYQLWGTIKQMLVTRRYDYSRLLAAQGFNPQFAVCCQCRRATPSHFLFKNLDFWCTACISLVASNSRDYVVLAL